MDREWITPEKISKKHQKNLKYEKKNQTGVTEVVCDVRGSEGRLIILSSLHPFVCASKLISSLSVPSVDDDHGLCGASTPIILPKREGRTIRTDHLCWTMSMDFLS